MAFDVSADAYGRFMGRYAEPLTVQFAQLAQIDAGQRVLDVGCGPGALTAELVERVGAESVAVVDPSPSFVAAAQARFPGVDVRSGVAESLPFADDVLDASLAQLVVRRASGDDSRHPAGHEHTWAAALGAVSQRRSSATAEPAARRGR